MLYAGITSLYSFKYSILNDKVKKLKQWSKSAGNCFIWECIVKTSKIVTSETIRGETIINTDNVKKIFIHHPKHLKPANDTEFGHYLAGLIDGDGHFSSKQQLVIVFNSLDIQSAYYIREQIGHGNVRKVKNKNAVLIVVASKKGIERIINLINNKIRTTSKFGQINNNILASSQYLEYSKTITLSLNTSNNLENHWLAGFSDGDASFQIKLINRNNKTELRLNYQIDQKKHYILILVKEVLGGNIGYRKTQDTYYYVSTSFGSAKKVVDYFGRYHMLSTKYINFVKWRKAYILIQNKDHLTQSGLTKIKKLKIYNE